MLRFPDEPPLSNFAYAATCLTHLKVLLDRGRDALKPDHSHMLVAPHCRASTDGANDDSIKIDGIVRARDVVYLV